MVFRISASIEIVGEIALGMNEKDAVPLAEGIGGETVRIPRQLEIAPEIGRV